MEIEDSYGHRDNWTSNEGCAGTGNGGGGGGGGGGNEDCLVWEDLSVMLPNVGSNGHTRRLLNGLHGYAQPSKIMAVMGPSGSGKSTFLDALSGRLSRNVVMTGKILLNRKKRRLNDVGTAYVTQEDTLLGTLSVRETITYSARLRLPSNLNKEEINEIVDATITEMGLQDCADRLIGNWHLRGISGGEKKRLSIALEILVRPKILFLDEPTSGLDSASSFFVVQSLVNIARNGRTVVSTIHQPSSEVFVLFDCLLLLSAGETVYFGDAKLALQFFAEAGFPCPRRRNPSDHFLRCINSDFDNVTATLAESQRFKVSLNEITQTTPDLLSKLSTAEIREILIRKYRISQYSALERARIQNILAIKGLTVNRNYLRRGQVNWWKQLSILTQRSFVNMWRDLGYYWVRIGIYILLSVSIGSIFFDVGNGYTAILARGACGGFLSGFMTFMSIGGFPSFIEELKVFHKERLNRHYGIAVYVLSNFISSFPYLMVMSICTATITFYMVKFRPEFSRLLYACLDLLSSIAAVESIMMAIASLVPNFLMGLVIGAGYIAILMMTSGFFRLFPDLPKVFWRYPVYYLNFGAWGLQGAYKNDMIGLEFDTSIPGAPKLKGEYILNKMLGISTAHSKWWDLAAVVAILILFRFLFYAAIKFKETTLPTIQMLYAKRTLRTLKKRPSFRKNSPFPSKRYQPQHSLSSQEGLSSPIPY